MVRVPGAWLTSTKHISPKNLTQILSKDPKICPRITSLMSGQQNKSSLRTKETLTWILGRDLCHPNKLPTHSMSPVDLNAKVGIRMLTKSLYFHQSTDPPLQVNTQSTKHNKHNNMAKVCREVLVDLVGPKIKKRWCHRLWRTLWWWHLIQVEIDPKMTTLTT